MKIVVRFDKEWTIEEVKNFIANRNDEKYDKLTDSEYLELVSCAEYYATLRHYGEQDDDIENFMNESAAGSIASGIECYFFDEMVDNYFEYYLTQIDLHPEMPMPSPLEHSK